MENAGFWELSQIFGLFREQLLLRLTLPFISLPLNLCRMLFVESNLDRHWILRADPDPSVDVQLNLTAPREEEEDGRHLQQVSHVCPIVPQT